MMKHAVIYISSVGSVDISQMLATEDIF